MSWYSFSTSTSSVGFTGNYAAHYQAVTTAQSQGPGGVGSVGYVEVAGHESGVVMLENFRTAFQRFPKHP